MDRHTLSFPRSETSSTCGPVGIFSNLRACGCAVISVAPSSSHLSPSKPGDLGHVADYVSLFPTKLQMPVLRSYWLHPNGLHICISKTMSQRLTSNTYPESLSSCRQLLVLLPNNSSVTQATELGGVVGNWMWKSSQGFCNSVTPICKIMSLIWTHKIRMVDESA